MMQRHDEAHRADAQPLGPRIAGDRVQRGRRHPAFVGAEMVLDAERVVEAELVAELELAPELLVALMRASCRACPRHGRSARISFRPGPVVRSRWELLYAGPVGPGQRVGDAHTCDAPVGRDLGERHQHEGALERARDAAGSVRRCRASRRHRRSGRYRACADPSAARGRGRGRTCVSTVWARASSACGASSVAATIAQLTNGGWSVDAPGRRAVVGRARDEAARPCRRTAPRWRVQACRAHRRHCRRARSAPQPCAQPGACDGSTRRRRRRSRRSARAACGW